MDGKKIFFYLNLVVFLFIIRAIIPRTQDGPILARFYPQNTSIRTLLQERNSRFEKQLRYQTLNFPADEKLKHADEGFVGFADNFFVDFEFNLEVHDEGVYLFRIMSDDGFDFSIGDKKVSSYFSDRAMGGSIGNVQLSKGIHPCTLNYFQGFGQAGLQVFFRKHGQISETILGADSSLLTIIEK